MGAMMRKLRPSVQNSLSRKARSLGSAASRSVLNRSEPCAWEEPVHQRCVATQGTVQPAY